MLFCKGCAPWKGLLLTGKSTHSLGVWGGALRGRMESLKEDRILTEKRRVFFFFFAVLVLKVKRRTEVQNPETLRGKDVVILREKS